jgi:hypothetical protein
MADDPDFRFYASFRDSPKRLALADALGPRGIVALVDLWCWVRANRPTGDLTGLPNGAIETAARWTGKRGALVAALVGTWLLGEEGAYQVHGWSERQGWAKSSPARSQAGKVAAIVKQARRHGVTTDQWLDDVGGEDARNERLRERARQAFEKRTTGGGRATNRRTNRSNDGNDRSTNRCNDPNESLPLVSTPSPSPSPTPSPTGGGGRAGTAPSGSSAARPPGTAPPGRGAGPPHCARCHRPADTGPSFQAKHLPLGLEEDLCPGHLTAWFEERDAAERAAPPPPPRPPFQPPSGPERASFRPPKPGDSS